MPQDPNKTFEVFTVSTYQGEKETKKKYTRIGKAFINRDESISVLLDAMPIDRTLFMRLESRRPDFAAPRANHAAGEPVMGGQQ